MKILYVENHVVFAEQVCRQFLAPHTVTVVPSLSTARQALADGRYDLLILDYDLDDGKGDELVRAGRILLPKLKIIAASAHEAGNAALLKAGADAVCSKMDFDEISEAIRALEVDAPRSPTE